MSVPLEVREQLRAALDAARNGYRPADLPSQWFESAADLLAEPDPGPTPFLVDQLLVEGAIGAVVGQHKQGKLELAAAIVTGREACTSPRTAACASMSPPGGMPCWRRPPRCDRARSSSTPWCG